MKKNKKKYIYVGLIIIFAGLGGFFLSEILKQSTLIGIIIGTMIATFIITALNPDLEKDMRKNLSKQKYAYQTYYSVVLDKSFSTLPVYTNTSD